jgi:hypothetical protein
VEDDLDASHRGVDALVGAEIAFDHLDLAPERGEVRAAPRREVVEHANVVATREQPLDEVRADEARAACHEDPGHAARSATTW